MLIQDTLERSARLFPEKEGLVFNGLRLTYRQLHNRVLRLSIALVKLGVKKGDRVASLMDNTHHYLEFFFASFKIGATAVPINHRLSVSEIEFILKDSGASALFISENFLATVEDIKSRNEGIKHFIFTGMDKPSWALEYEEILRSAQNDTLYQFASPEPALSSETRLLRYARNDKSEGARNDRGVDENDTTVILYTSGTTGNPKGVMLTHRNLLSTTTSLLFSYPFFPQDRYCNQGPLFHIGSIISMLAATVSGATHIFMDNAKPEATLEDIEREKVTMIMMAPTMLHRLTAHPDIKHRNLNTLRLIGYGGAPMPVTVLDRARQYFKCDFLGSYGTTETSGYLTILTPDDHNKENLLTSCGREVYGINLKVIDENGEDVKYGEIGEIIVKTDGIMKGYLNKPDETAKVIKNGWFHTGDMAKRDEEGYIYIVDRKKDMIITGGENVYSTEVENILLTYKGIEESAVIGIPDEEWGEVVTAVVVPANGSHLNEDGIIEYCKKRLTHYKCPKRVIFKETLPKSSAGKILKRELKAASIGVR